MSLKITILAFIGNLYFWTVDPLVRLYIKIKVRCRRFMRRIRNRYTRVPPA